VSAAAPIGDWDSRSLNLPFVHCSTYVDPEDSPPSFRIQSMPDDQDDSRSLPTIAPNEVRDTEESGPPTKPPGPADEAADVYERSMPPNAKVPEEAKALGLVEQLGIAPRTLEDSYLDKAIRVVASAGARAAEDREERRQQHDAVMLRLERNDANQSRNYELLRSDIRGLQRSDREQDAKIAELRLDLASMRDQLEQTTKQFEQARQRLETKISDLEQRIANDPAPGPEAPAA
jgi:type IV secretory pathway VirB10-like protein